MSIILDKELEILMREHNKATGMIKVSSEEKNCWDAGIEITKNPEDYKGGKYSVVFSPLSDEKIKILMRRFPHLEWLGYLVGDIDHSHRSVYISDIIIPKQKVSAGAVFDVEYGWNEGFAIMGVIHSHHGMGAFFSGTDDDYINQNHDVSIVVATRPGKEIKAQVRVKLDNGKYFINEDITFAVNAPVVLDVIDFHKVINENIAVPTSHGTTSVVKPSKHNTFRPPKYRNMSERIGFVPFSTFDEFEEDEDDDQFDLDFDEDEEDTDENEDDDGFFVNEVMKDIEKRDVRSLGTPVIPPSNNDKYRSMYVWPEENKPSKSKGWSSSPDYMKRRAGRK